MRKILLSVLTVGLVGVAVFSGTKAFFSDTETSVDNLFQAGAIDLQIDNESYYNGVLNDGEGGTTWEAKDLEQGDLFFNFEDLKPGDVGEDTISLHVSNNPAWACMEMRVTANDDNQSVEPELTDGDQPDSPSSWDGELAGQLNFVFWSDDGDNVLETEEEIIAQGPSDVVLNSKWALADSQTSNIVGVDPGEGLDGESTYYIAKAWCFGDLGLAPLPQGQGVNPSISSGVTCNGEAVNNLAQTDKVMADVQFTAIQQRHNLQYVCPTCDGGPAYADGVFGSNQGNRKDGSDVLANRSNTSSALGTPEGTAAAGTFFSLGFGGSLDVSFSNVIPDGDGVDISFHEITNGRNSYPLEKAEVFVSQDGVTWVSLGEVTSEPGGDGVTYKDLSGSGLGWVRYVRLVDTSNPAIHSNDADGYDVDGVDAVHTNTCIQQQEEEV